MASKWFDVLQPGTLIIPTDTGEIRKVTITKEDVRNAETVGNEKLKAGWQVPACWDHQEEAEPVKLSPEDEAAKMVKNTLGYIEEFKIIDGILRAKTNIPKKDDLEKAEVVKFTSPCLDWDWLDCDGKTWNGCTVQHLAITNRPVQRWLNRNRANLSLVKEAPRKRVCLGLGDYKMADEEKTGSKNETMSEGGTDHFSDAIKMLADRGIVLPEDTTPDNAWERLTIALTAIQGADPDNATETEPEPEETQVVNPNATNSPLSLSLQKLESYSRKDISTRIEACVAKGKITPVIGKNLQTQLGKVNLSFNKKLELNHNPVLSDLIAYEKLPENTAWAPQGQRANLSNNVVREVALPNALVSKEVDDTPEAQKKRQADFDATLKRRV